MIDNTPFDDVEKLVHSDASSSDDAVFSQLQRPACAPDLTRSIMGRLGYMQVAPRVVRRHRLRRWGSRFGVTLAAAISVGIGMQAFQNSDHVRRPAGPTIPAALQNDLRHQQDRFGGMIRVIREFQPRLEPKLSPQTQEAPPRPLNEDVNRAASSRMRWV